MEHAKWKKSKILQNEPFGTGSRTDLIHQSEINHIEAEFSGLSAADVFEVYPAGSGETFDTPEEEPMDKNVSTIEAALISEGNELEFNGRDAGK